MKRKAGLICCGISAVLLAACGGGGGAAPASGGASGVSSSSNSSVAAGSHNAGLDCMASCHKAGGSGAAKGIFTVAGTVYTGAGTAQAGATVTLYKHNTSIVDVTLTTDASGNFYTTQAIVDINGVGVTGVDATVIKNGVTSTMPGVISTGACNGCHGAVGSGNPGKITGIEPVGGF